MAAGPLLLAPMRHQSRKPAMQPGHPYPNNCLASWWRPMFSCSTGMALVHCLASCGAPPKKWAAAANSWLEIFLTRDQSHVDKFSLSMNLLQKCYLPGSVRQNAAMCSPEASLGRYFFFCSSVPAIRSPCQQQTNKPTSQTGKHFWIIGIEIIGMNYSRGPCHSRKWYFKCHGFMHCKFS